MSKIQQYLPVKSQPKMLIQGRVPAEIVVKAKAIMAKKNLNWAVVLTACIRQFVDEHKTSK